VPIPDLFLGLRNYHTVAYLGVSPTVKPKYWLAFPAAVPPLGFSTYYVSYAKNEGQSSFVIPLLKIVLSLFQIRDQTINSMGDFIFPEAENLQLHRSYYFR